MRRIVLLIHQYLGLFLAPYLVLYGVSAIAFNHHWGPSFEDGARTAVLSALPVAQDPVDRAREIRTDLGLIGDLLEAQVRTPSEGVVAFRVRSPGRIIEVTHQAGTTQVELRDRKKGWRGIFLGLHGTGDVEGTFGGPFWAAYTEVSIWALGTFVLSGSWMLLSRPRTRNAWIAFAAGSGVFVLVMWGIY